MVQPASASALPAVYSLPGPLSELLRAFFSCLQTIVSSLVGTETGLINASPAAQNTDNLTSLQCPVSYQGLFPPQLTGPVPQSEMRDTRKMGRGPLVLLLSMHAAFGGNRAVLVSLLGSCPPRSYAFHPIAGRGSLRCRPRLTNSFVWCWHETQGVMRT